MAAEARRIRRLAEELEEGGLPALADGRYRRILLEEVDLALRPNLHERRIPSSGAVLEPKGDPTSWSAGAELAITRLPVRARTRALSRRFVDGMSSWLVRRVDGAGDEWLLFDRPAGSERDLVVLAAVLGATIVQRHPSGVVRIVGAFGVLRWDGIRWHHEPPLAKWLRAATAAPFSGTRAVVEAMLQLAVHDLGAQGVGALLVYRPGASPGPPVEARLPLPPPLQIRTSTHLAPLRHALAQVDGAAVFDGAGVLRQLGVRLIPSAEAERVIAAMGGTRHTSALRYSHDDPDATLIVVSEDGPVSVLRAGRLLGRAPRQA